MSLISKKAAVAAAVVFGALLLAGFAKWFEGNDISSGTLSACIQSADYICIAKNAATNPPADARDRYRRNTGVVLALLGETELARDIAGDHADRYSRADIWAAILAYHLVHNEMEKVDRVLAHNTDPLQKSIILSSADNFLRLAPQDIRDHIRGLYYENIVENLHSFTSEPVWRRITSNLLWFDREKTEVIAEKIPDPDLRRFTLATIDKYFSQLLFATKRQLITLAAAGDAAGVRRVIDIYLKDPQSADEDRNTALYALAGSLANQDPGLRHGPDTVAILADELLRRTSGEGDQMCRTALYFTLARQLGISGDRERAIVLLNQGASYLESYGFAERYKGRCILGGRVNIGTLYGLMGAQDSFEKYGQELLESVADGEASAINTLIQISLTSRWQSDAVARARVFKLAQEIIELQDAAYAVSMIQLLVKASLAVGDVASATTYLNQIQMAVNESALNLNQAQKRQLVLDPMFSKEFELGWLFFHAKPEPR